LITSAASPESQQSQLPTGSTSDITSLDDDDILAQLQSGVCSTM
jgi:hypothetical protein